jgi:PASTA domain
VKVHGNAALGPAGRLALVKATIAVVPGETLVLESGGNGAASSVSRDGVRLLIAGGGDGAEPNYVSPAATKTQVIAPGAPITSGVPEGRIFVTWLIPRKPKTDSNPPIVSPGPLTTEPDLCVVPRLTGRRPLAARRSLRGSGCRAGTVTRRTSVPCRRGRVIGQSVQPGTELPLESKIRFVVGKPGPQSHREVEGRGRLR